MANEACWALPETAACAGRLGKLLGSTKWTLATARRIAALLRLDFRWLCWPVGTQRAITQATRLTVNHGKPLLSRVRRGVGVTENTGGNGFKSPDWARVQSTARPNHDKSSVTLQPPCCPPSIFVTSSKPVKVPQSGFTAFGDARI